MTDNEEITKNTKKDNRYAISIVFSTISLIASIVALAVFAPRESWQMGIDYLGIIVAILGVFITLLLGFQLYQALYLKEDAKKVEDAKNVIENYAKRVAELAQKIKLLGEYIDNPEWARVITDASGKWLFGIRHDGSVDWQVGIPGPIKNELEALKKRIAELEKKETNAPGTSGTIPEELEV